MATRYSSAAGYGPSRAGTTIFPETSLEFFDVIPSLVFLASSGLLLLSRAEAASANSENRDGSVRCSMLVACGSYGRCAFCFDLRSWLAYTARSGSWLKVVAYLYAFLWFRFTFPRYRFDH